MTPSPGDERPSGSHAQFTIAELVSMPHLGLELIAGRSGAANSVHWTHTSELEDPGPWLEGGELLIVNGLGIPDDPAGQIDYVVRLARHRLAGLAVGTRAPKLTDAFLAEADRLAFPVLRIPRRVPFIELSHLVANASERSARSRIASHLRIFETLRLRNAAVSNIAEIYGRLEQISGYRLALVTPAGGALLPEWPWVPESLEIDRSANESDLRVIPGGYLLPLFVGDRVTAYLVGMEHPDAVPNGLAALQHVSTLAALDAIDDQRRREADHRVRSALLARALEPGADSADLRRRFLEIGLDPRRGVRVLAVGPAEASRALETRARDWLADRRIAHAMAIRDRTLAVVIPEEADLAEFAREIGAAIGASPHSEDPTELPRLLRQAKWALGLAGDAAAGEVIHAQTQFRLARWLNPDVPTIEQLAEETLRPIVEHDAAQGAELLHTLSVYFHHHGQLRATAARLFVHEHTLRYRLKRIEQLTGRSLKRYGDAFELWLAVEASPLVDWESSYGVSIWDERDPRSRS